MEHRFDGQPQTSRARLGLMAAFAVFAGAMSGGCSMVDRPASEAGQMPAPAVTVRAQSAEPEISASPPAWTSTPSFEPVPAWVGAPPPTQPGPPVSNLDKPRSLGRGVFDTALESIFGEAPSSNWTPLSLATLFTEGWNQPFLFSPASDSGAFRQEWIDAANGVFYRQLVFDYNFRDHATSSGNRDIGTFSVFAPLSRRLELFIAIPFVDDHATDHSSASSGGRASLSPTTGGRGSSYRATFGDITITPQVLLCETRNTSIISVFAIRTPTGSLAAGNGDTSIGPQIQFWQGLPNRWVIRGSAGPTIPLSATGLHTTFDTNLTVGRFLTLDDARYFKETSVWVAASNSAAMDHVGPAADTLTILPGIRFRIAKDAWLLYGVEIPLVAPRNEDYGMYFRLVKRW